MTPPPYIATSHRKNHTTGLGSSELSRLARYLE
ncbi:hypothetical protein RSAG8_12207, partial [Rhizoctonia solani AG-8 WAC10335]